jgi:hypothetical protein
VLYALHLILCVHLTSSLLYVSKAFLYGFLHFASFKYVLYALYATHFLLLVLYRLNQGFKWFSWYERHMYLFSCITCIVCIVSRIPYFLYSSRRLYFRLNWLLLLFTYVWWLYEMFTTICTTSSLHCGFASFSAIPYCICSYVVVVTCMAFIAFSQTSIWYILDIVVSHMTLL